MELRIQGLSKTYANGVKALDDVSLHIPTGMFGLLGPNGAGKSTLMRILATLQEADAGMAMLGDPGSEAGTSLDVLNQKEEVRKVLGYLPQEFGVYPRVNAQEMLDHIALLKGVTNKRERKDLVEALLQKVNLWEHRKRRLSGYSGGMKQRFGIAQSLIGEPRLIIVDEPTAGLDPGERNRFYNLLTEIGENVIVILSTHIVQDVQELCSNMAIINKGRLLYAGPPDASLRAIHGRVWEKTIAKSDLERYAASGRLISNKLIAGKPVIRLLSDVSPEDGFAAAEPGLEDVFFSAISKGNLEHVNAMIARMFLFEVRYWLRQPMVYIFLFVNALLTFGATASDGVQIGGGVGNVVKNAPYVVYIFYGIMSFIALLMVTAFVNGTAIRDFTSNTAQIIFSTPVSKSGYLIGKFLGSTFVASIPLIGVSLGIVVGSWMPWVDPLRVGPNYLYPHVQGFLVMGLPNILFSAAIIFAVAVIQRSTMASFITAIVLFVGYSIASSSMEDMDNQTLAAMLDPFGTTAMSEATQYWTVDEKNLAALPVSGLVLWNRLLWIGVSALVFLFGYSRFSFTDRVQKAKARVAENDASSTAVAAPLPKVALHFDRSALRRQWSTLYRTELVGILKSTPFIIIMALGLAQLFTSLSFVTSMYGNTTYPVTYSVVDMISGNIVIYVMIIVVFYAGQLIWKERDPKFDGIINALPMATRTGLLAKLAALITVVFVVHLFAVGAGMTTQLLNGYTRLEPMVYLTYFVVPGTLFFAGWAAVALLVHVLVNNKYLGFFVFIVLFILNTFAWTLVDVESNLVLFNGSPGLRYSDMNGFGPYLKNWIYFKTYWILFAGLIVLLAYLFVVRGNDTSMRWRIHQARQRFRTSWPVAAVLGGAWLLMAGFGYYQTKVLNTYQTSDVLEEDQVRYEKEFKRYEHMAQPHYTAVSFTIDLDPPARTISYSADIVLKNKHTTAIDTLWLNVPHRMNVTLEIPGAKLVLNDDALDQRMYRLSPPLAAGAELSVKVSGGWKQKGIENETEFTGLVQNGSFFNNMELLPAIGYNTSGELQDRADRRKHGLPPNDRMPKLTADPAQRMQNYLMAHSDWMTVRTTISTSPDQIAIAPGSLKKEWTADGKRYFQYELDHKALNFFSFMSARYEVAREKWNDVDLEVYYQKEHAVNVPRMLNSMRKALTYYTEHFGPYSNKQARIIEFPRYASFAQAFPGTMPYSESIGFITDLTADEDIDMVFYVVAHEMGHQWWAHQVIGADMQGSTMLSESMAQYSALMVMEREYGRTHMRKFLKYESDKYQEARGGETIGETPLMYVENQGYIHYNKGSVVLYGLREFLGEDTLNKAFRALVDSFGYAEPPWPTSLDMYRELRKVTPDSLTYLLEDHLKYITLYDNRVLESTAHLLPDSSYEVTVKLTCEKNHADSLGRETPAPMNDWIDVGLLKEPTDDEEEGAVITFQRVRLRDGENTVVLRSEELPAKAAIDPMHLFFDRVPTDNAKSVEVK